VQAVAEPGPGFFTFPADTAGFSFSQGNGGPADGQAGSGSFAFTFPAEEGAFQFSVPADGTAQDAGFTFTFTPSDFGGVAEIAAQEEAAPDEDFAEFKDLVHNALFDHPRPDVLALFDPPDPDDNADAAFAVLLA
jgi:hypothetical protein